MEPKSTSKKVVKFEDFIKHNVESDCWIAVRGKVYDVTSWVPKHPGGVDPIVLNGVRSCFLEISHFLGKRRYSTFRSLSPCSHMGKTRKILRR
jgi:hypothetical protein